MAGLSVESVVDPQRTSVSGTDFAQVVTTIKALASEDERIVEDLRIISAGKRPSSGGQIDAEFSEVLGEKVEAAVFLENLKLKVWDSVAKLNWRPFADARAFVRSLGLRSKEDWSRYVRGELGFKPADIPNAPHAAGLICRRIYSLREPTGRPDYQSPHQQQ